MSTNANPKIRSLAIWPGFTIVELLVAVVLASMLVGMTVSIYSLFRKSMTLDQARADISQNARVALDRISRELRQTPEVITVLPADPDDTSVAQPGAIEFENGHDNDLTYYRYYLSGTTLRLDKKEYYLASDPNTRLKWNTEGEGGVMPLFRVISTQDIAINVQSMLFYGLDTVQIIITTADSNGQSYTLRSQVLGRNL